MVQKLVLEMHYFYIEDTKVLIAPIYTIGYGSRDDGFMIFCCYLYWSGMFYNRHRDCGLEMQD